MLSGVDDGAGVLASYRVPSWK